MMRRYALRDEQGERIESLLPGREGPVGGRPATIAYLSKRCCTATGPGFPGATGRNALARGKRCLPGLAAGRRAECGRRYFSTGPTKRTTNMP
jgi:hypothetical protein